MYLDRFGNAVHGVAGVGVFVNGRRIVDLPEGQAGAGVFWRDRVLYQAHDREIRSCDLQGGSDRLEVGQGATWLAAGGDVWIAHQNGGVLTSWGHFIPGAGALGVARDGSAVFVIPAFSTDRGIARYRPGAVEPDLVLDAQGPLLLLPYAQFSALDADRFIWREISGVLRSHGLPTPAALPWKAFHPSLVDAAAEVWVAYGDNDDQLYCHPLDRPVGYRIPARGFSICGERHNGGFLRLVWSRDTSENAASFDGITIALTLPRETFSAAPPPPPQPPPEIPMINPLRIDGKEFYRGDTLFVPRFANGLTLLTKTFSEVVAHLDYVKATGFNGVRVFAGALPWAGQTPEGAREAMPLILDLVGERDLIVEMTLLTETGTGYDARAHVEACRDILRPYKGRVLTELMNEVGHDTQDASITTAKLRQWGRELFAPHGMLWAVGAPLHTDEPTPEGFFDGHGGDYITAHLNRDREDWNNVRRVRELFAIVEAYGVPVLNNEPMGADEKHGGETGTRQRWNEPALFYTLGALERAFPGVGGVHHSQAGLHAVLPGPVQQACAAAYVQAHRDVAACLPVRGAYKNVGHPGSPYQGVNVGEQPGSERVRLYAFIRDGRGVAVDVGVKAVAASAPLSNGWRYGADWHVSPDGPGGRVCAVRGLTTKIVDPLPVPPSPPPVPPIGVPVTPDQIAAVVAGGFFERIATLIGAVGTVVEKRPKVHAWQIARINAIAQAYRDIFSREADLEGYGSRMTLFIEQGLTDAELRKALQDAYDRGDR